MAMGEIVGDLVEVMTCSGFRDMDWLATPAIQGVACGRNAAW